MSLAIGLLVSVRGSRPWSGPNGEKGVDSYHLIGEVTAVGPYNAEWRAIKTVSHSKTSPEAIPLDRLIPRGGGFAVSAWGTRYLNIVPLEEQIASSFAAILRDWLTPEEFEEMRQRNQAEPNASICHSHDFCDANMAMDEAMRLNGQEVDLGGDRENWSTWNAAWAIASQKYLTAGPSCG